MVLHEIDDSRLLGTDDEIPELPAGRRDRKPHRGVIRGVDSGSRRADQ